MSSSITSLARDLYKTITESDKRKVKPYDSDATVVKVEDDVVWVKIPGGVDVTPVKKTINAKEGDTVKIRVSDHRAWITGNNTAPPTDDTRANKAETSAKSAHRLASEAFEAANNAEQKAYDARSQAEIAYNLAGTAKRSADGKNTIYRGATQPSGSTYVAGDTWFDTSHDNKIYRYDGTSWVAVTLGDDAIGELNANHITAGEIDASQITVSNLDAGNITTGLLDADYIDVNDVISKGSIIVTGSNISDLNNDSGFQTASQVSSAVSTGVSGKADKTDAVAKTQRIYYRSNSSTKPTAYPTGWVTEEGNKWNSNATTASGWSRKVTPISNGTGSGVTKYLYLWTATQKQMVNGSVATLTANDIALDDTTTVIDGGNIVTGTVTANKLNASDINASNSLTIGALSTSTQSDILNSNINVGGRNILAGTATSVSKATTATSGYVTQSLYYTPFKKTLSELGYKVGDEITLSFDWKITSATTYGNARIEWYGYKDASNTDTYLGALINPFATFSSSNTSGHVETTVTLTSTTVNAKRLVMRIDNSDLTVTISNLKLEKGNKATAWTPAPEDTTNDNLLIDSQKMGSWQIGANASLNSSGEFGVATITGNTSWTGVIYSKPTISASVLDGSPLWLSFEYQYSEATAIAVSLAGTSAAVDSTTSITRTRYLTKWPVLESKSAWTKYSIQMPSTLAELTSGSGDVNSLYVQFFNYYTAGSTLKIRKVKLEHGIASSDWTPSPQDQKAYITRIDDAGIRIHPADTINNSVVINASGMEVFKGGTASANSVAFYGDTARIGVSSSSHMLLSSNELTIVDSNGNNGFRVVDSGSSARILKTVHVHKMVATNAMYVLTLPLCISGTAIKVILYEYDNDGAYAEEEINLTAGTTSSGSNAACTYSYNGSTRALTITANSSDPFIEISTYQCYPTITETIAQIPGELSVKKIRCNDYDMVDFVAQQGTSGIWTYRVWKSGIKECWGIYTASIAVNTSAAAYGGYRSAQISMPAFPIIFTDPPVITATAGSTTGFWVNNIVPSSTGGKFYLSAGSSLAAANRSINFHVIGK